MIKEVREVTDKEFELPTEGNNVADQPAENVTSNESLESSAAAIADSFKQDEKTVVEPTAEAIAETIADINSDAAVAVTAMPTKAPKKEKKKKDEYRVSNFDIRIITGTRQRRRSPTDTCSGIVSPHMYGRSSEQSSSSV